MRPLILPLCLLLATIASVHSTPLSYELIDRELLKLGENPKKSILVHFPANTSDLVHQRATRLDQCYKIYPGQGNIFKDSLGMVIYKYLNRKYRNESKFTEADWRKKVHLLNGIVRTLTEHIVNCVASNDPEPTRLGMTSRSDLFTRFSVFNMFAG